MKLSSSEESEKGVSKNGWLWMGDAGCKGTKSTLGTMGDRGARFFCCLLARGARIRCWM